MRTGSMQRVCRFLCLHCISDTWSDSGVLFHESSEQATSASNYLVQRNPLFAASVLKFLLQCTDVRLFPLGAWTIHFVLIILLKILFDIIPGVSTETSWTLTNISYMFGSYLMFHYVRGVPFEFNAGAYDNLNMWEQIDNGDQYTPAKKFLLSVPIVLFLLSTHYTHYETTYFTINFLAVLGVVIPKLPSVSPIPCLRNSALVHDWTKLEINPEPSHAVWVVFGKAGGSIALGE